MHQGRIAAQGSEAELTARLLSTRSLELEVRGGAEALTAALAPIPAVRKLHVTPHGEGVVRAQIELEDAAREQVSRAIVEAGLGLLSMHGQSTGLEAVFLQLSAGGGAADSSSGQPPASARPQRPQTEVRA